MKIDSIQPLLYHLSYFTYEKGARQYTKISFDKSQYVYRILLIDKGALDVCVGGKAARIEAGDALYLVPGEVYRLCPCGEDFSLYNLFFDFLDNRPVGENKHNGCVFMKHYRPTRCLPLLEFEDAPVLNKSGIFRHVSAGKAIRDLLLRDRADTLYGFFSRLALFSLVAKLLAAENGERRGSAVSKILEYIRTNPEKDLSGEALSKIFSYHKNHINKQIKQETGRSLGEYVRHVKIEHAKTLLAEELCSPAELAERLGYYDYSHFYKAFCRETGTTPTAYIKLS